MGICRFGYLVSSKDGRPRPGLPSGKDRGKRSDHDNSPFPARYQNKYEQFGCPSVLRLFDTRGESETPSVLPHGLRLLHTSLTGDTSPASPDSVPERKAHEGERKFAESFLIW